MFQEKRGIPLSQTLLLYTFFALSCPLDRFNKYTHANIDQPETRTSTGGNVEGGCLQSVESSIRNLAIRTDSYHVELRVAEPLFPFLAKRKGVAIQSIASMAPFTLVRWQWKIELTTLLLFLIALFCSSSLSNGIRCSLLWKSLSSSLRLFLFPFFFFFPITPFAFSSPFALFSIPLHVASHPSTTKHEANKAKRNKKAQPQQYTHQYRNAPFISHSFIPHDLASTLYVHLLFLFLWAKKHHTSKPEQMLLHSNRHISLYLRLLSVVTFLSSSSKSWSIVGQVDAAIGCSHYKGGSACPAEAPCCQSGWCSNAQSFCALALGCQPENSHSSNTCLPLPECVSFTEVICKWQGM